MRHRPVRLALAALLASTALVPLAGPAGAGGCAQVFPASYAAALKRAHPQVRITASVYDVRTGCWYDLHPELRLTTASVVKAGVLAAALLRAQDAGRALTAREQALAGPMIRLSHNPPTASLYASLGGPAGLARYEARLGATTQTRYSSSFGATLTSARDRTLVSLRLLRGGGALRPPARASAWRLLGSVHPTQRWGVSAGVRTGYEVALKNGFYPMRGNGWRLGSTGVVRARGTDAGYAITVLTDRAPDHATGQRAVEDVSRRVASLLTGTGPVLPRSVDRAVCVQAAAEGWPRLAARLGLAGARAGEVRSVSGGNPTPLRGQRACAPRLRP